MRGRCQGNKEGPSSAGAWAKREGAVSKTVAKASAVRRMVCALEGRGRPARRSCNERIGLKRGNLQKRSEMLQDRERGRALVWPLLVVMAQPHAADVAQGRTATPCPPEWGYSPVSALSTRR